MPDIPVGPSLVRVLAGDFEQCMRCSQLSYWLRSARRAPPPISQWSPVHRASLRASSRQGSDVSHRWCSVSRPRTPSDGCDRQVCARFRSLVRKRDWSSGINVDVDGGDRDVGLALRALRAGARAGLEGACLCGLNPPLSDHSRSDRSYGPPFGKCAAGWADAHRFGGECDPLQCPVRYNSSCVRRAWQAATSTHTCVCCKRKASASLRRLQHAP